MEESYLTRDLTGGDAGRLSSLDGHDASMVGLR